MRGDAVFYLLIFLCATFYYYGTSLLSAFNALQTGALSISLSLTHSLALTYSLGIFKVRSVRLLFGLLAGSSPLGWQLAARNNVQY